MMERIEEVKQRYELWWTNRNTEPLFYVIYPKEGANFRALTKPWMSPKVVDPWSMWQQEFIFGQGLELTWKTGQWRYVDEALALLERYTEVTGHAAEGFSFLLPSMGPGCVPAFITNYTQFHETTIWLELPEPWDWDTLRAIDENVMSSYAEVAIEATKRLVKRLKGRTVIATPDLGGPLDMFSAIRGAMNLLMDTVDRPDEVAEMTWKLERIWRRYHKLYSEIIDPANPGCYAETMRYLSSKPTHIGICDFSAMISPEMFRQFALPTLKRECEQFKGRVVYHMDGPGQVPHLELLLSVENLHAIQWVPGAGNPGNFSEKWFDLYQRILDAGKKICLCHAADAETMRAFFQRFPKRHFYIPHVARDQREAEAFLRVQESVG